MAGLTEDQMVKWLKLTTIKGLGPRKLIKLFSIAESIDAVYNAADEALLRTKVFTMNQLQEWNRLKSVSDENFMKVVKTCKNNNINIIPLIDERYPQKILRFASPPYTLFLKGDVSLLNSVGIAIVGTRAAQENACRWAFNIAKKLCDRGFTIVSGGAIGIDAAAHSGALASSHRKTVCVFGSGLLRPYPPQNISLFNEIAKDGLLISEHLPNFPGSRIALIQRNRITSGLSEALILCASGITGGAMVQSKIAHMQGIPILIPSSDLGLQPDDGLKFAKREYNAKEMTCAEDITDYLEEYSKKINTLLQKNITSF